MENHPMVGASFVSYLAGPEWSSELQVPKEFVKEYAEILQPTIELRIEGEPRKSWKVETEIVGKRCFLTEGWSSFAQEVGFEHQGTLVFTFMGESVFNVSVYDATCCKKKLPSHAENEDDENQEIVCSGTPENWEFSKKVKDHHISSSRMDIPKKFVVATGIQRRMKMVLVDEEGRRWPITVTDRSGRQMFNMSAGFIDYLNANDVLVNSTISFNFIRASDNAVEARVTPSPQSRRPIFKRRLGVRGSFS